jgi:hypothetical protein
MIASGPLPGGASRPAAATSRKRIRRGVFESVLDLAILGHRAEPRQVVLASTGEVQAPAGPSEGGCGW